MADKTEPETDVTLVRARLAGQIAKGLFVGFLIFIAVIEFYGQIGNLGAFQYQGY